MRRPARLAYTVALAHELQRMLDEGEVESQKELAAMLGVTAPRITQILELTLPAPDIAEEVLAMEAVDGVEPIVERDVRPLLRMPEWPAQREMWRATTRC